MIDLLVLLASALAALFLVAWIRRPGLRDGIERPKHNFQSNVQSYDHGAVAHPLPGGQGPGAQESRHE